MFTNHLKIAWRNLWKSPGYSLLNVLGLSVGIAGSLLMLLWLQDEVGMNRHFPEGDRIAQLYINDLQPDGDMHTATNTPWNMVAALRERAPGIAAIGAYNGDQDRLLKVDGQGLKAAGSYASPEILEVFQPELLAGERSSDPKSVALSEDLLPKLFGAQVTPEAVLGRTVEIDSEADYHVTSVYRKPARQNIFTADYLLNIDEFIAENDWFLRWGNWSTQIYLRFAPETSAASVAKIATDIYTATDLAEGEQMILPAIEDIYLYGKYANGVAVGGRIQYVRIFFGAALFLILIACINFVNLSTARAGRRAREVGVRKVIGADRSGLFGQFMIEAGMVTVLATAIGLGLAGLSLPGMNALTEKTLRIDLTNPSLFAAVAGLVTLVTLLSGAYPALILSGFRPLRVLKGTPKLTGGTVLRRGLVVFQFALCAVLILSALVVNEQIQYLLGKDTGLDRREVIFAEMSGPMYDQYDRLREQLLTSPVIESVSRTSGTPTDVQMTTGDLAWAGKSPEQQIDFKLIFADPYFADNFRVELRAGRFFDAEHPSDTAALVINQTLANLMGMKDPIGQSVRFWGDTPYHIVGVVEDFHINSFYQPIDPLILAFMPENTWSMAVRAAPGQTAAALAHLEKIYAGLIPEYPLNYELLDDTYAQLYRSERLIGSLARSFATVAILIALLGLLGLTVFMTELRTKEIGIRKVLGASVTGIVSLLSREFIWLVLAALLLAMPVAWLFLRDWLAEFAFGIELSWHPFAWVALIALALAGLTVGLQSLRAALANPVDSIRRER